MIVYKMQCALGHEFEGWFKNSAAYDEQAAKGELACPICGDTSIRKAPMAPAVAGTKDRLQQRTPEQTRQFMAGFRKFVQENSEYVGRRFPEEARKIHHGEKEERNIYGEASLDEAKELVEEGITIAPLPPDPEKMN